MTDGSGTQRAWSWDSALQGIIPPMISPLTRRGAVDGAVLNALVAHLLDGGCSGIFVLGGCGEGAWLTPSQRVSVIRATVAAVAGRAPVLAGAMLPATGPAIEAARWAADAGADALVVGSPYYFTVNGTVQARHIEVILAAVPLPVLLYNIPQSTHNVLAPATVRSLAVEPRILGIKDSAGDFEAFQFLLSIKKSRPDFRVLQGHEAFAAASLLQGGDGLVPGMANFVPALFVALHRAAATHDVKTCVQLQEQITALGVLHTYGHWLPALKAACAFLGLGNGIPSPPLLPATEDERRQIRSILAGQGLLPE
jgi:4-hydroxy-tetrahydrodipicolinate synthase